MVNLNFRYSIHTNMSQLPLLNDDAATSPHVGGLSDDQIDYLINKASDNIENSDEDINEIYSRFLQEGVDHHQLEYKGAMSEFTVPISHKDEMEHISDLLTNIDHVVEDIGSMCIENLDKIENVHEELISYSAEIKARLNKIEATQSRILDLLLASKSPTIDPSIGL